MKPWPKIIEDIKHYLQDRSKIPDQDYISRRDHFNQILLDIENKHYGNLVKKIDSGIDFFHHFFTSNRYANFLSELKEHLVPIDEKDANQRLRKLLAAILNNDMKRIEFALEEGGCLAVLNRPYSRTGNESIGVANGDPPILVAFKHKNLDICAHLFKQLDPTKQKEAITAFLSELDLNKTTNTNPIFNKTTGYSLLHFAAEYGFTEVLDEILSSNLPIDINITDNKNATPLYLACSKNEDKVVDSLLAKGANVNVETGTSSPFWATFIICKPALMKKLIAHGAKVDRAIYQTAKSLYGQDKEKYEEVYKVIKEHYKLNVVAEFKRKKQDIIKEELNNRALVTRNFEKGNSPSLQDNITGQLYFENPNTKTRILNQLNQYINSEDEVLKPLLTIIAMEKNNSDSKPLKTIINDQSNIGSLVLEGKQAMGVYRGKNTVYIAGNSQISTLGIMLHEWKHFVDLTVFGNRDKTFNQADAWEFSRIKSDVINRIEQLPEDSDDLKNIKNSFRAVFHSTGYKSADQDSELLARVPEVLGILGIKQGKEWFNNHMPLLLKFYEDKYNLCCREYIENHQVSLISNHNL